MINGIVFDLLFSSLLGMTALNMLQLGAKLGENLGFFALIFVRGHFQA